MFRFTKWFNILISARSEPHRALNQYRCRPTLEALESREVPAQWNAGLGMAGWADRFSWARTPMKPIVTITATDSLAAETDRDSATLTVVRKGGNQSRPLTVSYQLSGTAVNGMDIENLSGSLIIPARRASATIVVTPINDTEVELTEDVVVSIRATAAYRVGSPSSAFVIISSEDAEPLPVLMVLANRDFYYREYNETRISLEAAGLEVVVTAANLDWCRPHANSGQGSDDGWVMPALVVQDADASDYSAIVFVGGWGSSSYQYAFEGTYVNSAYNGSPPVEAATSALIGAFADQGKYLTAICHGVTVLAYARVDGVSPLDGRTVCAYALGAPAWNDADGNYHDEQTRWHVERNGATQLASRSVGDPTTAADDVWIDGQIITAENYDSASYFGQVIAERLRA